MKRFLLLCIAFACSMTVVACTSSSGGSGSGPTPIRLGAIYPLSGAQGDGGIDEHRGVLLAQQLVNADGGVNGHPVQITSIDVAGSDAAASAVDELHNAGIQMVLGSYGSTISGPASSETAAKGMLFWETGAVGMLPMSSDMGSLTFRVPPTGGTLGRSAIDFMDQVLAPKLHRDPASLTFAVANVNDVYGTTVADGAIAELKARGLTLAGQFPYDFTTFNPTRLARRIAAVKPDILFVSAYLKDGMALRRALVAQHVPLLANIGTSSSYCMPAFGDTLGSKAVGVFASDKPDAKWLNPDGLQPAAAALLERANGAYEDHYGTYMSAPALSGFSASWALFKDVLPTAASMAPTDVAAAARTADITKGSLPNGSGLRFGAPGTPGAGDNLLAASVVWEWVAPGVAKVVWPPAFASSSIKRVGALR
jgi:branched-chain amino acid transport system substrate-binding protein